MITTLLSNCEHIENLKYTTGQNKDPDVHKVISLLVTKNEVANIYIIQHGYS